ncbi:ribosomal protein L35Ae-domain-containing protein, partial [Dichotomocladium elegans]
MDEQTNGWIRQKFDASKRAREKREREIHGRIELTMNVECLLHMNSLYSKGRVLGYERAKRTQNPNVSLIKLEGVQTTEDARFYLGKRVAYVYYANKEKNGSKLRVIWGRIARPHGTSGVVKARFRKNLPPKSFGASVRVVSHIKFVEV